MAAYLVVDVDDLLAHFRSRGVSIDLQELAVSLRGSAALAAGLVSPDRLKAIAVADWNKHEMRRGVPAEQVFKSAGYDTFYMPHRAAMADALIIHYFSYDPEPVDELILATTSRDLLPVVRRVRTTRNARIRMWGSHDVLQGTEFADEVVFQPLEALLGIQTKNVAVYIDFENISISLNEQGFVVNLDHLIDRFVTQAKAHGQVVKMAAYAPWGQRGTLPPLIDTNGREVTDEAPSRLALANIDPVFNLPGKNSADIRIARDVMMDANHNDAADIYILASGDRDFNDVINALLKQNKVVIVWGVRGSTSRMLEKNSNILVEYIDDFTNLQTHQSLSETVYQNETVDDFTPSQWTSVILQFDRLTNDLNVETVSIRQLVEQLQSVGAVASRPRGEDLVSQSISLGILKPISTNGHVMLNDDHPIVYKTRLIAERIVLRVQNTLQVRGWEYVNYGFLLKGLAMDRELDRPGCNSDDQWRSHWIDTLVREQILERQLVPHRHNPDDLVPVIKLCEGYHPKLGYIPPDQNSAPSFDWSGISLDELYEMEPDTADMVKRIVVSVEQFTSFRSFAWCPLGSLHRRLRAFDTGVSFQRAVEYLLAHDVAVVDEYPNPQSQYNTKGISLNPHNQLVQEIVHERDQFIKLLLVLYERNLLVSKQNVELIQPNHNWNLDLWFSIMETENVLNALPGRPGQYSLFRTHHTVNLIAGPDEG
ncbi:MAG: NYN domain-containing protein [Chloroflexi bacterium]|nr:MAG: NYN domain-containing protein [Chloroflexota bacterium]